ncbi:MAG: hypothetical protein HOB82_08465, partial [Alphaproteobacteria bacterium]|nr:hypothetical protein [Alphaproteobacteria bacterium]
MPRLDPSAQIIGNQRFFFAIGPHFAGFSHGPAIAGPFFMPELETIMTRGLFSRPFEETISNAYDAVEARNRREDEARDRRDALLKGNTLEETNVYDQTHEREARKDRSAVLTSLPEPDLGG